MASIREHRPLALWLLLLFEALLGLGGLYGGITMLLDPSGQLLGLPPDMITRLPVDSYSLPGLFLCGFMGLLPLVLCYALWYQPAWSLFLPISHWGHIYWAWTATLFVCIALFVWLSVEYVLIGYVALQLILFGQGLLIVGLLMLPSVRRMYVSVA